MAQDEGTVQIWTVAGLAHWIGANDSDEASLSHRIYKDTTCGAWLALYRGERRTVRRPQMWTIELEDSKWGIVCVRGQRPTKSDDYVSPDAFPNELQMFLSLSRGDNGLYYVCQDDPDMQHVSDIPETDRVKRTGDTTWTVEVDAWTIEEPDGAVVGVQVGSIVEGADADTQIHTLTFPFTLAEFYDALQDVEDEADAIWRAWHGDAE